MNSAAVLTLAAELNAFTKFVAMPMRGHGNVTGADVVMRWTTGLSVRRQPARAAIRASTRASSRRWTCWSAATTTRRLILGADPGATMPQPAIEHLARIPTIVLDPKVTHTSRLARVHITTAATGISAPGTVYRMDEMPLPLRPALKSPYPTDEEVVRRIRQVVARSRREPPVDAGLPRLVDAARRRSTAHAAHHRREGLRPRQRRRRRDPGHLHLRRPDRLAASRAAARSTRRAWSSSRAASTSTPTWRAPRSTSPAAMTPENQRQGAAVPPHAGAPQRARRADAHDVRHRLPLRRDGLHDGQRGGGAGPVAPSTRTRSCATRRSSTRRVCLLMANNEIVLDLLEAGETERASTSWRGYIWAAKTYGVKAVNPGGVAAWKWGKNAKSLLRAGRRLQQGHAGDDHREPRRHRRRALACRTRSISTATTWACPATSPPPSRP